MARFLKCVVLALLVPLLLFGGTEVALRLLHIGYPTTFLVRTQVGARERWVDNVFYGYRFFPPRMSRTTTPIVLDRAKKPGAIRIFILGESAAMGEPQSEHGPARWLETILAARYPSERFEVINAAMTAINSHVIADIAGQLARCSPDVIIVYMGNNEVVGPYGPGTVFDLPINIPGLNTWRTRATSLRLSWLLGNLRGANPEARWTGMEMFESRRVRSDDHRLRLVYADFERNLRRILDTAHRAGAQVLLSTVAVNLEDCAPFAGETARAAFQQAKEARATGDVDRAFQLFREARDLDELRFRADSRINEIIRKAGADPGVVFVDCDRHFEKAQREGVSGQNLFVDHVHFAPGGNYRLAAAWAYALTDLPALKGKHRAPTPTQKLCEQAMLCTPWTDLELTEALVQRRRRAPFIGQPGNDEQLAALIQRRVDVHMIIEATNLEEVRQRFEDALRQHPDDARLMSQYAGILLNVGDFDGVEKWLRRELDLEPHRFDVRGGLALALGYQGRFREAFDLFAKAPPPRGAFPADLLIGDARVLARDHRVEAALAFAREAAKLAPDAIDIQIELAARLADAGYFQEARALYQSTSEKHPQSDAARGEWIAWNVLNGDHNEALRLLDEAIAMKPDSVDLRVKRAQILTLAGRLDEAGRELDEAEATHPDNFDVHYQAGMLGVLSHDLASGAAAMERALQVRHDARGYFQLARIRLQQGNRTEAIHCLESAVKWEGDQPEYLQALAWLLATSPEGTRAEAERARELGRRACVMSGWKDPKSLDALAAAHAAAGYFDEAREISERAIAAAGSSPMAAQIAQRRDLYAKGQPYRAP